MWYLCEGNTVICSTKYYVILYAAVNVLLCKIVGLLCIIEILAYGCKILPEIAYLFIFIPSVCILEMYFKTLHDSL